MIINLVGDKKQVDYGVVWGKAERGWAFGDITLDNYTCGIGLQPTKTFTRKGEERPVEVPNKTSGTIELRKSGIRSSVDVSLNKEMRKWVGEILAINGVECGILQAGWTPARPGEKLDKSPYFNVEILQARIGPEKYTQVWETISNELEQAPGEWGK